MWVVSDNIIELYKFYRTSFHVRQKTYVIELISWVYGYFVFYKIRDNIFILYNFDSKSFNPLYCFIFVLQLSLPRLLPRGVNSNKIIYVKDTKEVINL